MGRQKIEIKKINCAIKRRETFRKRSRGILKKVKELTILCDVEIGVIMFSPSGKCEHFSNGPRTGQVLQQFQENIITSLPEEDMAILQVQENVHMPMPIQHIQAGDEVGKCIYYREEFKFGCSGSHSLESENLSSSMQQIGHGREEVLTHIDPSSMQASMLGQFGPSDHTWGPQVGGLEMPLSNGVQSSSSLWCLPEGVIRSNEYPVHVTTKHEALGRI